ncbi:MAG: tetratricopeptide repeat protein [Prevotellaceae bacterium]|jgi:tetratricopeptide (TPR) repeat protein|nr:tetratricopeptide repeat protein [Prevotellaceae bacterium]
MNKNLIYLTMSLLLTLCTGCETKKARQEKADMIIAQARAYAEQADYLKAIETYDQIYEIEHSDSYEQIRIEKAKIYMTQRRYGDVLSELNIYASGGMAEPEILILWVQARMGSANPVEWRNPEGNAYKTIRTVEYYVKLHPEDAEVLHWLGILYSHASDFDYSDKAGHAIETCRKAIELNPDDPAGYYFLAIACSKDWDKRLDRAEEACLKAIRLKPDYTDAYTLLATVYWRQARSRYHYYSKFTAGEDGSINVAARPGSAEELKKLAIDMLLKSIKIKPDAWAWNTLGEYLSDRHTGLDHLALNAYEHVAKLDPLYPGIHTYLGHAYSKKKRWADAVKSYEEALKINPFDAGASTYIVGARKELDKQTPL